MGLLGCANRGPAQVHQASASTPRAQQARLSQPSGGFEELRASFEAANPGYGLTWHGRLTETTDSAVTQVLFVQVLLGEGGRCRGTVGFPGLGNPRALTSDLRVGDIVVLRPGESLSCSGPISSLTFEVPTLPPESVPHFIRPDFDPLLTDTPGGCAEEDDAYRRILLTWQGKVGPYLYHAINAHRVRILDSFTHYHPAVGGFDEFYLVQEAPAGAELIVSEELDALRGIAAVTRDDVSTLLRRIPLYPGQLVYLPRTVVHRGIGGAVVQVITVPGFVPGAEISVDAELTELNRRFDLTGERALPVHSAGR